MNKEARSRVFRVAVIMAVAFAWPGMSHVGVAWANQQPPGGGDVTSYTIRGDSVQVGNSSRAGRTVAGGTRAPHPRPTDVLDRFLVDWNQKHAYEVAMAGLFEGIRTSSIRYDDGVKLRKVLGKVSEYYVRHPNPEEFSNLVLVMLDERRIRVIVDGFYDEARQQQKLEDRRIAQGSLDSTAVKASDYMELYRLAVKAEEKWWAPVVLSVRGLGSRARTGEALSYSVGASNRAGRSTALPPNLVVQVVPPDAADHDAAARSILPKRVGAFSLRAGTPDGILRTEHEVVVEPVVVVEPPMATLSPEGGVFEVNQLVKLNVTANTTLQRSPWEVSWDPPDLIHGLKTYNDSAKVVMTIRGRHAGIGMMRVVSNSSELTQARLYVLPPKPEKAIPLGLMGAAIAAYVTGVAAGDNGDYTAKRWLTLGATPVLGAAAGYMWYRYFKAKKERQRFLDQVPGDISPKGTPVAASETSAR